MTASAGDSNLANRIAPLGPERADLYFEHLLRLDASARRMRFFADTEDFHLALHAGAAVSDGRACLGYFENGVIRGAAELIADADKDTAAAAFSVESDYRKRGIGGLMMEKIIAEARRRNVDRIKIACLPENIAMQRLAVKFLADLRQEGENILGLIER